MKKFLSTFLMITVLISFSACSLQPNIQNQPEATRTPIDIESALSNLNDSDRIEVQTAVDRNITAPDLLANPNDGITKKQMIDLIENCLVYLDYETDHLFEYQIKGEDETVLTRDEAAKLLVYAMTDILEITEPNGLPREYAIGATSVENFEKTSRINHNLLLGQFDLTNGLPVMDSDSEYRFHSADVMTKLEAIKSVARLSNSILPEAEYVNIASLTETINYPEELLSATNSLYEIDPNNLPFHGIDLPNKAQSYGGFAGSPPMFVESDVALLKEMGFNFLRVPITAGLVYNPENMGEINMAHLRNMDELVEWGMKYEIHICFALFLWEPDVMEEVIPQFWEMMSQRYANVPASILSFNIINEPYETPGDDVLASIYDQSIESIRTTTPDRLIFIDSLLNNENTWYEVNDAWYPLEDMADKDVILTYHFYQPETVLGLVDGYPPQDSWPFPFVNDNLLAVEDGGEPIIIEGNFPKDTKIILRTIFSGETSGLLIKLNGNAIYDELLSDHGQEVMVDTEIILPDDGNTIEINTTGHWQKLGFITIVYPELAQSPIPYFFREWEPEFYSENRLTHIITCRMDTEEFHHTRIIVNDDGTYYTEGDGFLQYDKDYLEKTVSVWTEFKERTGTPVMLHEFTMYSQYPTQNLHLGLLDDYLTVLDENNIAWSTWDWERLMQTSRNFNESNTTWIRMGNHNVNKELLDILQKHINN